MPCATHGPRTARYPTLAPQGMWHLPSRADPRDHSAMNIFLSWSGKRSLHVATALRTWIPMLIQGAKPWMSSEDIEAGARWNQQIADQLRDSNFAIIVLTAENLEKPWLMFEAGACAKALDTARVCPFLIDLKKTDVKPPLGDF